MSALPRITNETLPFWDGTKRDILSAPYCVACQLWQWPPAGPCKTCHGECEWRRTSGTGVIETFTVEAVGKSKDAVKILAFVRLDDGFRMFTKIVGAPVPAITLEAPVAVAFEPIEGSAEKLPVFTLAK